MNGEFITPASTENILLGITRDTLMELARREFGRITRERQIDRTELYVADEILLCGTGAQIAPVVKVDHRPIGDGKIGPISSALQQLYFDVVRGRIPEYREQWCTPVYVGVSQQLERQHLELDFDLPRGGVIDQLAIRCRLLFPGNHETRVPEDR